MDERERFKERMKSNLMCLARIGEITAYTRGRPRVRAAGVMAGRELGPIFRAARMKHKFYECV